MLGVREQLGHKRRCISQPSGWGPGAGPLTFPAPTAPTTTLLTPQGPPAQDSASGTCPHASRP